MAGTRSEGRFGIVGSIVGGTWWAIKGFMVLILTILFYIILISILGAIGANKPAEVPKGGALVLAPQGLLVEQLTEMDPFSVFSLMSGGSNEVLVSNVVKAIDTAAEDDRIKVLVMKLDGLAIPTFYASKSYKIAEAVDRFKASGKDVIALGNGYGQGGYLIASHADEIWMHPFGNVFFQGYERSGTYMKTLLDNMMITIHPFKVGEFKSAIEPQTRDDMSEAAKISNMAVLGDMWSTYIDHVSAERGLADGALQDYADNLNDHVRATSGDFGKSAVDAGIVDKLLAFDELRAALIERVGEDSVTNSFRQIDMQSYLMATAPDQAQKPAKNSNIAVIVAKGTIVDGEAPRGTIGGDTIARVIRRARDNDSTKAIVLRVDSGGGSAFASEVIRRELVAAQEQGIPVVASMGSVAASGGYWISMSADRIFAEQTTVTGSIGVIGLTMTLEKLGDWAGIHGDGVGTTDLAGAGDIWRPMNPEFADIMQLSVENIYDRFVAGVVDGTGLSEDRVREVAEGRVWSAPDALDIGLIDEIGDLDAAIAAAAELAGVEDIKVNFFEKEISPFDQFIHQLQDEVKVNVGLDKEPTPLNPTQKLVAEIARQVLPMADLNDPNNVYVICEVCEVH